MPQDPKMLTHEQMRSIIQKGGSVLHNGQVFNNLNQLPPPEALVDNPADQEKLLAQLEKEEADLKARREALQSKSFSKVDESKSDEEDEFKRLAAEADAKAKADAEAEAAKGAKKK